MFAAFLDLRKSMTEEQGEAVGSTGSGSVGSSDIGSGGRGACEGSTVPVHECEARVKVGEKHLEW